MNEEQEKWALCWCNQLHPVIFGEIEAKDVNRYLKELSQKELLLPNGTQKKISHSTWKRKLKQYREGGFDALARKPRSDRGKARVVPPEVIATAIEAKKEQPRRSVDALNRILRDRHGRILTGSTLYRHLRQAGATRLKLGVTTKPVRKRWSREHTHDLWLGDFEEGPYVQVGEEVLPTYLSAFIDCYSRYLVDGRYYLRQNLDILIDSWLRALATHGASLQLYLDNAKVYHAKGLKVACYKIPVRLWHRPPRDPAPGGLIERFFQTAQSQFEAEVRAGSLLSLDELNRTFSAWLEVSYHPRVNADTGQTPKERYDQGLSVIRQVDLPEILECFLLRVPRTVDKVYSDLRLHNQFYQVDPTLRGDRLEVRYDPFSPLDTVQLYSLSDGVYLGQGRHHTRQEGAPSTPPPKSAPPKYNLLDLLVEQHEQQLADATPGIDYRKLVPRRPWPFQAFVKTFAHLLGHKEGLAAFNADQLETLKKLYNRSTQLNQTLLKEAVARAPQKSMPAVAYELRQLLEQKRKENP